MQSTTSFPGPCISFSHNRKVGKGPGNKATQTFATLVHATSNNETVGVDYGNIFSVRIMAYMHICIMLVTTVEKLRWVSGFVRCVSEWGGVWVGEVCEWVGEVCEWGDEWVGEVCEWGDEWVGEVSGLGRCVRRWVGYIVHVMNWTAASCGSICSETVFNLLNWNLIPISMSHCNDSRPNLAHEMKGTFYLSLAWQKGWVSMFGTQLMNFILFGLHVASYLRGFTQLIGTWCLQRKPNVGLVMKLTWKISSPLCTAVPCHWRTLHRVTTCSRIGWGLSEAPPGEGTLAEGDQSAHSLTYRRVCMEVSAWMCVWRWWVHECVYGGECMNVCMEVSAWM